MRFVYFAVALFASAIAINPVEAVAQTSNERAATTTSKPAEKQICEKIIVTGSRIAAHTYCATPEQWAQQRLQDRQMTEQIQMSPCVLTHNGASGKPSC